MIYNRSAQVHIFKKGLDYNYITDGVCIGNSQCCQVRFNAILRKEGVITDIFFEDVLNKRAEMLKSK